MRYSCYTHDFKNCGKREERIEKRRSQNSHSNSHFASLSLGRPEFESKNTGHLNMAGIMRKKTKVINFYSYMVGYKKKKTNANPNLTHKIPVL
jgi:hypothetical protein